MEATLKYSFDQTIKQFRKEDAQIIKRLIKLAKVYKDTEKVVFGNLLIRLNDTEALAEKLNHQVGDFDRFRMKTMDEVTEFVDSRVKLLHERVLKLENDSKITKKKAN